MSKNIEQIFVANPITTNASTDLMYFGQSPYGAGNDAAMTYANFSAQFAGNVLTTKGDIYTFSTVNTRLAVGGTNGQILQVNSGAATGLAWSTATYPATTTINQLLYSSSANVVAGLATANTSALTTNGSGVPGFTAYVSTAGGGGTSNIVARDANGNSSFNNYSGGTTGNVASGTVTLTAASSRVQIFSSGSGSAICVLPDATTLTVGWQFVINNNASGTITVETNGGSTLVTMPPASFLTLFLTSASFSAGQWDWHWSLPSSLASGGLIIGNGTNAGYVTVAPTNNAALSSNASGIPTWLALTDGQVVVGSSAGAPVAATLTAGTGIAITNGNNSISIATTGGGQTWSTITAATLSAAVNNSYVINHASTPCVVTLPATAALGSKIGLRGLAGSGGWTATANTSQTIQFGNQSSSSAGSWSSTDAGDSCDLECIVANTTWTLTNAVSAGLTKV